MVILQYWLGPRDLKYFGDNNSGPIIDFLRSRGVEEAKLERVAASMQVSTLGMMAGSAVTPGCGR